MGSNSLLEGLVLGERVGANAAAASMPVRRGDLRALPEPARPSRGNIPINLPDITYSMKSLMWRQMGVIRSRARLEESLPLLELWSRATLELGPDEPRTWELVNMLAVARLGVVAALTRTESRGVHFRSDHPETDPKWLVHTRLVPEPNGHNALASVAVELTPVRGAKTVGAAANS
jgi:L-aspartate oxidase